MTIVERLARRACEFTKQDPDAYFVPDTSGRIIVRWEAYADFVTAILMELAEVVSDEMCVTSETGRAAFQHVIDTVLAEVR